MNDRNLDLLRSVHDETGVAMVFAGNADLRSRFGKARMGSFDQFVSRLGARLELEPCKGDIRALALHLGADEAAAAWLAEHTAGNGNLRKAAILIAAARELIGNPKVRRQDLVAVAEATGVSE